MQMVAGQYVRFSCHVFVTFLVWKDPSANTLNIQYIVCTLHFLCAESCQTDTTQLQSCLQLLFSLSCCVCSTVVTQLHTPHHFHLFCFKVCKSHMNEQHFLLCSVQDGEIDAEELQKCLTQSGFTGSYTRKFSTSTSTSCTQLTPQSCLFVCLTTYFTMWTCCTH